MPVGVKVIPLLLLSTSCVFSSFSICLIRLVRAGWDMNRALAVLVMFLKSLRYFKINKSRLSMVSSLDWVPCCKADDITSIGVNTIVAEKGMV